MPAADPKRQRATGNERGSDERSDWPSRAPGVRECSNGRGDDGRLIRGRTSHRSPADAAFPPRVSDCCAVRRAFARRAVGDCRQSFAVHRRQQSLDHTHAGDGHRHCRRRPDPRDPHGGHRSFDRRHHGDFLGGHGAARRVRRRSDHYRFPARAHCRRSLRLPQWHLGHAPQDAAVHRHAGNAQHHRRAQHLLFAERNDRDAGHPGQGLVPADHGQSGGDRLRPNHVGHLPVARLSPPSSGTSSTAPPTAATSTPRATTRRPRGLPASIRIAFCSAYTCSRASSRRSPAGR